MRKMFLAVGALVLLPLGFVLIRPSVFDVEPDSGASAEAIAQGKALYAENCASCHGEDLEGQPGWKERLPSGRMPAPPHDASGHTWHHSDEVLFFITKEGAAAVVGDGYESDMPGFADALSDDEIRAVIDYIKSTWPERQRNYQEEVSRREREATQ